MDKKTILVTGGAGFIGSHLCDELLKASNQVICLDDFTNHNEKNIDHLLQNPDFEFIKWNINQPLDLDKRLEAKKFDVPIKGISKIYHLACPTSAKNFDALQIKTLQTNCVGVINILELAKHYQAKILLASSCVVYGARHTKIPAFPENYWGYVNFLSPRACYDEGKRFAETIFITYRNVYKIPIKVVRIFRTYGPRMPLFDGQMIADFVLQALTNQPLVIYGDQDFSTSLCYINDVVDGLIRMMDSSIEGPLNLGSPKEYKLIDVAQQIIKMCNSQSIISHKPSLKFISALGLPDISLAKRKLDWYPVVSLEEGLKNTIDYIQRHRLQLEPLANQQNYQNAKSAKS